MWPISDDPYQILGVPPNAKWDVIKRAYRQLVRQCHPDLHPNKHQAEDQLKTINAAYAVLSRDKSLPHNFLTDAYDVTYSAQLTFDEARNGAWRSYSFHQADGQPYTIRVWIPAGSLSGVRIRVPGAGGPGHRSNHRGDFYVEVHVVEDVH
jgi:DnaJ-class molecular chaperone